MVTLTAGWKIFVRALKVSQFGSLSVAAEWMYRLNVFARSTGGRHPIIDQIYGLKNALIKCLYLQGYCTQAKIHLQNKICYGCDGTGEYWTGADCHRCNGTGIYSSTRLYAFRFKLNGHSYAWHQPQRLIDYDVQLTEEEPTPFVESLRRDEAILSLKDAWLGCCVVWWCLLLHGRRVDLLLFDSTRNRIKDYFAEFQRRHDET